MLCLFTVTVVCLYSVCVLSLQNDLDRVVDQLHAATASQQSLQAQLEMIRTDRDSLLEELRRSGIGLQSKRFFTFTSLC